MKILVADDQAFWRRALEDSLIERGYEVVTATDGDKALHLLEVDPHIDVLITDWVMPGLTGVELCGHVRAAGRARYLPILLMTSRTDPQDLIAGLDAGADAFLRKPFDEPELLAQLRVAERILALENRLAARINDLEHAQARLARDLNHAADVQRACMPRETPDVPGVSFAWYAEACEHLGGDLFNVIPLDEDHVALYALDVSGHGTPAALYSVSLSHVLHPGVARGGLLRRADGSLTPPAELAAELNARFPLMERSGHYFTLLYGVLELSTRYFEFVRAGHPHPIIVGKGAARIAGSEGGVPIGAVPDTSYQSETIRLEAGEGLLLVTDGVFEARDEQGEEFGTARTLELLEQGAALDAQACIRRLRDRLDDFRKEEAIRDDITMLYARLD